MTAAPPWVALLDHLTTPKVPADRSSLLWESDSVLAGRGLSSGEQSIVAVAQALRAIYFYAEQVDQAWQDRITDAAHAVGDCIGGGDW